MSKEVKEKKEPIPMTPQESQSKVLEYINSDDKVTKIIGLLAKAKRIVFENNIQVARFYGRHVRAANELDCYSTRKIMNTMKYLLDNADYKWELSTVLKYIDEDFNKLDGLEPIIILRNGERIYNVERIKQLEREGAVYYGKGRWNEVI